MELKGKTLERVFFLFKIFLDVQHLILKFDFWFLYVIIYIERKERGGYKMVACPVNDWLCPYFENGDCTLENCEQECDAFYGLEDEGGEEE